VHAPDVAEHRDDFFHSIILAKIKNSSGTLGNEPCSRWSRSHPTGAVSDGYVEDGGNVSVRPGNRARQSWRAWVAFFAACVCGAGVEVGVG